MQPEQPPQPRSLLSSYLWLGFVALLLGTTYAIVLWRMQPAQDDTTVLAAAADSSATFATVQPFTLIDSRGQKVTNQTLLGRPAIVAFVFTRCTGPCPGVTSSMKKLHDLTKNDPFAWSPSRSIPSTTRPRFSCVTPGS